MILYHTLLTHSGEYHFRSQPGRTLTLRELYFAYIARGNPRKEDLFREWIQDWWQYEPVSSLSEQSEVMRWPSH